MSNWKDYNNEFYIKYRGYILNNLQDIVSSLCIIDYGEDEEYWGDLFNEELINRGYFDA